MSELVRIEEPVDEYSSGVPEPDDIRWVVDNGEGLWSRRVGDALWTCRSQPGVRKRSWEDLLWKYSHLRRPTEEEITSFLKEERLRTADDAVARLDAIGGGDPERAHREADEILLSVAPANVKEAYERLMERSDGWWFA